MKIILLKDIKGVGKRFEEKEVSDGYGTNFLIPKNFAVPLSGGGASRVRALKEKEEGARRESSEKFSADTHRLAGEKITVRVMANEKGHLFAALDKAKISKILKLEKNLDIGSEYIILESPIKETGTFEVPVSVGEGKETSFTLEVERS